MAVKEIIPYLMFGGDAEKALRLYEKVLGAKVENLLRYKDGPAGPPGCEPSSEDAQRVMHALLQLGPLKIMAGDCPSSMGKPSGENVQICLEFDDPQELRRKFDGLADKGTVRLPVQDTFWGAVFGMVTDSYGIQWMFSHTKPK
jgi:PhnB protein